MCVQSIKLTLPFCRVSQEKQTKCSLILRTTAVGIGAISLLIGVLTLCGVSSLSTLGTTNGSLFCAGGILILVAGACLRRVEEKAHLNVDSIMSQLTVGIQQYIQNELSRLSMQPNSRHSTASFYPLKGGKIIYALFIGGEKTPYFFNSADERTDYNKMRLNGLESTPF